jgi:hypothetical protein
MVHASEQDRTSQTYRVSDVAAARKGDVPTNSRWVMGREEGGEDREVFRVLVMGAHRVTMWLYATARMEPSALKLAAVTWTQTPRKHPQKGLQISQRMHEVGATSTAPGWA